MEKLFIWLLLTAGLAAFIVKIQIVYPIEYVGHADASGYAEMADSLIKGRGLEVDYVSWYFLKYDPRIVRPEDHWPPLYSFLIAPFFKILGKNAFAAKMPSIFISCLLFPFVVYALAEMLSGSRIVGLAAGLHILLYPEFFRHSLYCLSDITFAFMVCTTVLLVLKGTKNPRFFYPMGIAMGLAYYAKGTGLILIPAYAIFYLILRFTKQIEQRDRQFVTGLVLAFLVISPWFLRNLIHFGNPIFSTQQFAVGYIGYLPWEEGTYKPYLGENLPSFFTKVKDWGISGMIIKSQEFLKQYLWWSFIDINGSVGKFDYKQIHTYPIGIASATGLILFVISYIYQLNVKSILVLYPKVMKRIGPDKSSWVLKGIETSKRINQDINKILRVWHIPQFLIVWCLLLFLHGFHAICWRPISRLAFPAMPLVIATGWTSLYIFFGIVYRGLNYRRVAVVLTALILLTVISSHNFLIIDRARKKASWPYGDAGKAWIDAGKWIRSNAPNSITMTRNPWELHFYSEEKAIQIPLADLKKIIEIAIFYGVTHLIPEKKRPGLEKWLSGEVAGLELVYNERLKIYKIHYGQIPNEYLLAHTDKK
ncbi:TPA: phospholipid carrier-dependent glycosyltransferase [Candidatus Poribacteria bacterium]|nr:phospholipid carrier-dependent glycosyltransferase [Candidatus Poribacteria bacterium]HIB88293.1 phospholipid carrier-dependent glycosyltransferase [Candidatus Poribacteria bacterium]HIN31465.1 phospholipid carrier-dependent glycosyltransferase [Candidatus Poribacteria bacterium]HIO09291.1 phospholipid carrier-dependent glycosyltransferase [Candidatus Poribacteria bacterium]